MKNDRRLLSLFEEKKNFYEERVRVNIRENGEFNINFVKG